MLLIVNLHNEMTPLEVEALKHRILAEGGVMSVEWQESAQQSVQRTVAQPCKKHNMEFCSECFPVVVVDFNRR